MNKLTTLLILLAMTLPMGALAQPEDGPPQRPDRDRQQQRERGDRPDRSDDRDRDRDRSNRRQSIAVERVGDAIATLRAMQGQAQTDWLERIEKLAQDKPDEAAKHLSRYPRLRDLMEMRKDRPAEFELHAKQSQLMREVFPMVREIRQAKQEDEQEKVSELRAQLRERFEALFEVRLKLKEIEIERIRGHLQDAEQELAEIKADGDTLIDEKLNELIERGGRPHGPRGQDDDRPERDDRDDRDRRPERDDLQ